MVIRNRLSLAAALLLIGTGAPSFAEDASTAAPAQTPAAAATPAASDEPAPETAAPETDVAAGHSYHGDAFNEGPRQKAYLVGGTGDVHFPCTCASAEVQQYIDQGVGQLHGFWYYEAERSFRQAARLDPDCAIAYWGMAMANVNNAERAKGFIAKAVERQEKSTRREQLFIKALEAFHKADPKGDGDKDRRQALIKAYENILHEFPDDIEAKAFLCLQIYDNRSKGVPISSYFAVNALLQEVLAKNPLHPCHHYVIHLWDYEKPERALQSAALCGPAAPAIAHMWHMPGHIYSRLKRYHDAVWQQEASARVDHAHMMRDRVMPDQIHNFAHNNEWLIRNLIFIGRAHDALDLARNMIDLPRHPKYNTLRKGSANFGRLRLVQVLNDFELWNDALALAETRYLEPTNRPEEQLKRVRLLVRAHLRSGDLAGAEPILAELRQRRDALTAERDEAVARAERILKAVGKPENEIKEARKQEEDKYGKQLKPLNDALNELDGLEHFAHGRYAEALEALKKAGSQPASLMALVNLRAGQADKAVELINKEVSSHRNETIPLAHQAYILWEAGQKEDARKAFDKLRDISETIDLDVPLFARLAPLAEAFGYPSDWRQPLAARQDLGDRPALDSLGPFRWEPSAAPSWSLEDHVGTTWSLSHFRGKPVIVIFYLGQGCLHCVEQLQAFAPMTQAFQDAGIELIAISTDDRDKLALSQKMFTEGEFPFPLVENHNLTVFHAYRCFDDFEEQPLHGTFLIDADGQIRWQDIGYEPFMEPRFLLAEARRLLSAGPVDPEDSAATAGTSKTAKASDDNKSDDNKSGDDKSADAEGAKSEEAPAEEGEGGKK